MSIMSFTITIKDDSRVQDVLAALPARAAESIDQALSIMGSRMLQELQDATPKGETGNLAAGWTVFPVDQGLHFINEVEYATWVEEGTGIFGPTGQIITPKNAKKLRFVARDGTLIFTKSIKGMQERPFIDAAWDEDEMADEIADLVVQGLFGDIQG